MEFQVAHLEFPGTPPEFQGNGSEPYIRSVHREREHPESRDNGLAQRRVSYRDRLVKDRGRPVS
jgi:hypothetical protein